MGKMQGLPLLVISVLNIISWIILLAGVGASQSYCEDNTRNFSCSKYLSFEWWITWFQFFVVAVASVASCTPARLATPLRKASMLLFAMVSSIMMVNAKKIYDVLNPQDKSDELSQDFQDRINCYFAGLIMSMIFNIFWIFAACFLDESSSAPAEKKSETAAPQPAVAQPAGQWVPVPMPQQPVPAPEPAMAYGAAPAAPTVVYVQQPAAT